jgi:hypothetical protein
MEFTDCTIASSHATSRSVRSLISLVEVLLTGIFASQEPQRVGEPGGIASRRRYHAHGHTVVDDEESMPLSWLSTFLAVPC